MPPAKSERVAIANRDTLHPAQTRSLFASAHSFDATDKQTNATVHGSSSLSAYAVFVVAWESSHRLLQANEQTLGIAPNGEALT